MSTWFEGACVIIQEAMKDAPADMPLKDRRKAVNAARPYEYHVASWGKKTWARAARAYLELHGLPKLQIPQDDDLGPLLSPLDRAKARAIR